MILRSIPGGCILSVRVHASAKRDAIAGTQGDALKISVTRPASDGRANAALIAFLAERLDIPRASIELIAGMRGRSKTLRLTGITVAEAEVRLLSDLA